MIVKDSPAVIHVAASKATNKSSNVVAEENDFPNLLAKVSSEKSAIPVKETKKSTEKSSKPDDIQDPKEPVAMPTLLTDLTQLELTSPNPNGKGKKEGDTFVDPQLQSLQQLVAQSVQTVTAATQGAPAQFDVQPAVASGDEGQSVMLPEKQNTTLQLQPLAEVMSSVQGAVALPLDSLKTKVDHHTVQNPTESKQKIDRLPREQHVDFLPLMNKAEGNINTKEGSMTAIKSEMMVHGMYSQETHPLMVSEAGLHPNVSAIHELTEKPASVAQTSPVILNQVLGTPAWQQALGHQLSYFSRNGTLHNAELRLHPEELGMLKINLRLNNDQIQLHFLTENHQVSAALEAAMPYLRTSLIESGINLGQSSISAELASSRNFFSQSDGSSHSHFIEDESQGKGHVAEDNEKVITRTIHYSRGINTFV